jgi:DNA-binding response OmpR family regulator
MGDKAKDKQSEDAPVRILLIEDDQEQAVLLRKMLQESGAVFDLDHADRLASGLERLGQGGIDIVLLDLALPDSYGLDTVAKARAQAGSTPIVVLSGLDDKEMAIAALERGAQDYLVKGEFDVRLLVECLHHVQRHFGASPAPE